MQPQECEVNLSTLKERAKVKLARDMGTWLTAALNDPQTVEIMVNADGRVWQEKLGESMGCIGELRPAQTEAIIKTVAGYHSKEVTKLKNQTGNDIIVYGGANFVSSLLKNNLIDNAVKYGNDRVEIAGVKLMDDEKYSATGQRRTSNATTSRLAGTSTM